MGTAHTGYIEMPPNAQSPSEPDQYLKNQEIEKKVIKTGGITFETDDINKTYVNVRSSLAKHGAYIADENQRQNYSNIWFEMTVRVPSSNYDTLYTNLLTITDKIDNKYSKVEDVTEKFYDLKSRIANKKALEARYIALLTKAEKINDILQIENSLNPKNSGLNCV